MSEKYQVSLIFFQANESIFDINLRDSTNYEKSIYEIPFS